MPLLMTLAVLFLILAVLAYAFNRRLGVLGFALTAGSLLSGLWADSLTPWLRGLGIDTVTPSMELLIAVGITLLPALLLLTSGPSYAKKGMRALGAVLFGALACAFVIDPLSMYSVMDYDNQQLFSRVMPYQNYVITVGVLSAWIDLLITKTHKPSKDAAKH